MSLDRKINRIQFLSGNSLKVIAVLTMLIDHLCKIVLQWLLSNDIVNIGLHFFLKDVRPMLPPVMNHSIAVA